MAEITLNPQQLTNLDNHQDQDFNKISFDWKIDSEEIKYLTQEQMTKLWTMVNLSSLSAEVKAVVTENPGNNTSWNPQQSPLPVEKSKPVFDPEKLEREWYTNLYILFRWLELWYIPDYHDLKFKDPSWKFKWNKWNWVKHKAEYMWKAWPITKWKFNKPISQANSWTNEKIIKIAIDDVDFEQVKIRESLLKSKELNSPDISGLEKRMKNLEWLKKAIISRDIDKIDKFKKEYFKLNQISFDAWRKNAWDGAADLKKQESEIKKIEKVKKEILSIEWEIDWLKKQATDELVKLNKLAWKDPAKLKVCQDEWKRIIEDINKQILELEKKWVNNISRLDYTSLESLSKESKLVKWLEKANWWLDKIINSKWWKIVVWAALLSIVWNSKDWITDMFKQWISKETWKSLWDLAVWFLPVVWWMHDLVLAWNDVWFMPDNWEKDYKEFFLWNRELSDKEKMIRTWFWTVWLIPGWSLLVKWTAKVGMGTFKMWTKWIQMLKGADIAMEWVKLTWKTATYSYLWYSLVTDTIVPMYHNLPK